MKPAHSQHFLFLHFWGSKQAGSRRGMVVPGPFGRPQICLFGDSITQFSFELGGWGAVLASEYQRHADVLLRGYSGYNTRWALELLPSLFPAGCSASQTPVLVTVFLGANDANRPAPLRLQPEASSRQHVPIDEYCANLAAIVQAIRRMGDGTARVLLLTPPPVDGVAWHAHCARSYGLDPHAEPNRDFETTAAYATAALTVAGAEAIPVADVHAAFLAQADWKSLLDDGLHPNARGNAVIADAVRDAIGRNFPELVPANPLSPPGGAAPGLQVDFPDHKAVDAADPAATFAAWRTKI